MEKAEPAMKGSQQLNFKITVTSSKRYKANFAIPSSFNVFRELLKDTNISFTSSRNE